MKIIRLKHFTIICVFAISFACLCGTIKAQETISLTLDDSIKTALKNNPSLKSAEEKVKIAEQKANEARASFMPSVSGSGTYTYLGVIPEIDFDPSSLLGGLMGGLPTQGAPSSNGSSGGGIPMGYEDNYNLGISIQQPLFTWGKIYNAYKQAKINLDAEKQGLEAVKQQIIFDTTKAFYGALLTQELVKVTSMAVDQVKAHVKVAQDLVDAGMATNFDLLRAKVQLSNIQSQFIKMQNMRELAKDSFKLSVGISLDTQIELDGNFIYKPIEPELDKLIEMAIKNRPEIKQLELQEMMGEKIISLAKAGNKPNLALVYSDGVRSYADKFGDIFDKDEWERSWNITLALSVPIFDGFATKSRVKQAKSAVKQIQIGKGQLIDGITMEVRSSYMSLIEAKDLLNVQQETIQQAQESLRIANLQYKNGMLTSVELMDTELALTQAQTNYTNALNDYVIAIAKLEKATASKLN
ncbi:TPA: TolC family protein [bacterium]|nr:TolC family protein [bacterium]